MKKIYLLSVVLIGLLFSCSDMDEISTVLPEEERTNAVEKDTDPETKSTTDEGAMPAAGFYGITFTPYPYDSAIEEDPYFNYAAITWDNTNYTTPMNIHQFEMQVQYRESKNGVPEPWKYAGYPKTTPEGLPYENNGIYKIHKLYKAVNFNALDLPYGDIDVRFRLIHTPSSSQWALPYENNISKWSYEKTWMFNPYGYGRPGADDFNYSGYDKIKITISLPETYGYNYTHTIDTQDLANNSSPYPTQNKTYYYWKYKKSGKVSISVIKKKDTPDTYDKLGNPIWSSPKYAKKEQAYTTGTSELNFTFIDSDF